MIADARRRAISGSRELQSGKEPANTARGGQVRDRAPLRGFMRLTRRPLQIPPAEHVDVEVRHRLARRWAVVDHDPISSFQNAELLRHFAARKEHSTEQLGVGRGSFADAWDHALGHDEHVHRGLRRRVVEGEEFVRFVDDSRGNFPGGDALEDGHASEKRMS